MPKTMFFDCFAGASGDMLIGALLDAGLDVEQWKAELNKLALPEGSFDFRIEKTRKLGLAATKFSVFLEGQEADAPHDPSGSFGSPHAHRGLSEINEILDLSAIEPAARALAKEIFWKLALAEGKVHALSPERVHFHEVGAIDALIDIAGFALGYTMLNVERVVVSPLVVGSGMVRCAHGLLPVPVPAVVELLRQAQAPMRESALVGECLTPTGAAILTTIADAYAPGVAFCRLENSGYGAGKRDHLEVPNVTRVLMGSA